jgi:hypothetical protein
MIFGKGGYFTDEELELRVESSFPNIEEWQAGDAQWVSSFRKGKFIYSWVALNITTISADCDKF